jgi:hypothetical protein
MPRATRESPTPRVPPRLDLAGRAAAVHPFAPVEPRLHAPVGQCRLRDDLGCPAALGRNIKVEFARLLKDQGHTLGEIAAKTGIPKTSLHRYLTPEPAAQEPS